MADHNHTTRLNVKVRVHGVAYETSHDADAVLAAEWAADNRSLLRSPNADDATRDVAAAERAANLGEARRLANAAALEVLQRPTKTLTPWEARRLHTRVALKFIRATR